MARVTTRERAIDEPTRSFEAQGITGVGAAILFLVCWVVFTVSGAKTWSLQETVALEAFVGLATMIPFVASAGMREHTNFQILVSFLPFQVACVPLGTLALQRVSPAILELTFAGLIAVFVCERVGAFKAIGGCCRSDEDAGEVGNGSVAMNDVDDEGESAVVASPTAAAAVVEDAIWYKEPAKYLRQPVKSDSLTFEGENWKFMLAWAVSGCASGFLGGMTGTHGPPAIACYTLMKIDKAVVRATSAAVLITVMCARLVTYAINGLFEIDRPGVYGCAGACGLAGVFFGIYAQRFVDKERFARLLLGILALGSVLMLYKGIEDL